MKPATFAKLAIVLSASALGACSTQHAGGFKLPLLPQITFEAGGQVGKNK